MSTDSLVAALQSARDLQAERTRLLGAIVDPYRTLPEGSRSSAVSEAIEHLDGSATGDPLEALRAQVEDLVAENRALREGYASEARIVLAQALDVKALGQGRRRILVEQVKRMAHVALGQEPPRPRGGKGDLQTWVEYMIFSDLPDVPAPARRKLTEKELERILMLRTLVNAGIPLTGADIADITATACDHPALEGVRCISRRSAGTKLNAMGRDGLVVAVGNPSPPATQYVATDKGRALAASIDASEASS